jgi:hypothetical protein
MIHECVTRGRTLQDISKATGIPVMRLSRWSRSIATDVPDSVIRLRNFTMHCRKLKAPDLAALAQRY